MDTGERETPAVLLQKKGSTVFTNGTRNVHTSDTRDGKYYTMKMDKGKRPVLLIQITGGNGQGRKSSTRDTMDGTRAQ